MSEKYTIPKKYILPMLISALIILLAIIALATEQFFFDVAFHLALHSVAAIIILILANKKLGAIVGFNKEVDEALAKGIAMQVVSMNPVAVSADLVPQSVIDEEISAATQKTKDELVQKAVDAALSKAGINPAHVDSEDHIESNQSKGWITAEQAEQAREIIKTVSAEKAANLPAQMVENIAKGRLAKFFKEQTLEEQAYQMGDGKTSVKDVLKAADAEAKVVGFYRVSLCD